MGGPRRVVFFAYYFPPLGGAGSARALSFARHLPASGWEVVVVTPETGVYGRDPSLVEALPGGVEVVRTGTMEPAVLLNRWRSRGGVEDGGDGSGAGGDFVHEARLGGVGDALRRVARRLLYFPDSSRGWVGSAVKEAARGLRGRSVDVVLSSSPPVSAHLAAERFARLRGVPFVADFRDLWEPALREPEGRAGLLLRRLARSAAAVTTVSEGYAAVLRPLARGGVAVVRNGWEPTTEAEAASAVPTGTAAGAAPFLLHGGTTYAARQDFVPLAALLEETGRNGSPLVLRMPGRLDPATEAALAPFAARGVVSLDGFLPSAAVRSMARSAAAVVAWAWDGPPGDPVSEGHLPAKFMDALGSGRPLLLLAAPGSEAARLGADLGLRAFHPSRPEPLREVLRSLASGEVPPGLVPRGEAAAAYTRRRQAEALAAALDGVRGVAP